MNVSGVVRRVPGPFVHLTFDDGPVPGSTERVLDALARHGARATFFVVVERARRERALLERIRREGHGVGNHSLDHRYGPFFRSEAFLKSWIRSAHEELAAMIGEDPIGFRSPAGVRTPPLHRALGALGIPLVHWNVRFFDTVFPWGVRRAEAAGRRVGAGSIVLLHDAPVARNVGALEGFLRVLEERRVFAKALERADVRAALTARRAGATVPA